MRTSIKCSAALLSGYDSMMCSLPSILQPVLNLVSPRKVNLPWWTRLTPCRTINDGWMHVCLQTFKGHTAPMCFKFVSRRDVVRMYVRDHMRTSKVDNPDCWLPQDGYNILTKQQASDLLECPIYNVVPRPVPIAAIQTTIDKYKDLEMMTDSQLAVWDELLRKMTTEYGNQCDGCRDLRERESATNSVSILYTIMYVSPLTPLIFLSSIIH